MTELEITVNPENGQKAAFGLEDIEEFELNDKDGLVIYFDNGNSIEYDLEDISIMAFSKSGVAPSKENGFSSSKSRITIANTLKRHHDEERNYIGFPSSRKEADKNEF